MGAANRDAPRREEGFPVHVALRVRVRRAFSVTVGSVHRRSDTLHGLAGTKLHSQVRPQLSFETNTGVESCIKVSLREPELTIESLAPAHRSVGRSPRKCAR